MAKSRAIHWSDYHTDLHSIPRRAVKVHDMKRKEPTTTIEVPGSFESPESSTIRGAEYDDSTRTLSVHFKRAKDVVDRYDYAGVPAELWGEFVMAQSKGQFFAARIRPLYVGVRITRKG